MKFLTFILSLLLSLLIGHDDNVAKNSLHKKPTQADYNKRVNDWIQRNFYIIALGLIFLTFITVCFIIVGASATDSGTYYNQFQRII